MYNETQRILSYKQLIGELCNADQENDYFILAKTVYSLEDMMELWKIICLNEILR